MIDQERFAENVRQAGKQVCNAEIYLAECDAEEKKLIAQQMVMGEAKGMKSVNAQIRYADESIAVYKARLAKGVAKGKLAAAKAELTAAEMSFNAWRTTMATTRMERNIYK